MEDETSQCELYGCQVDEDILVCPVCDMDYSLEED